MINLKNGYELDKNNMKRCNIIINNWNIIVKELWEKIFIENHKLRNLNKCLNNFSIYDETLKLW